VQTLRENLMEIHRIAAKVEREQVCGKGKGRA
jgi:hypothetical protein